MRIYQRCGLTICISLTCLSLFACQSAQVIEPASTQTPETTPQTPLSSPIPSVTSTLRPTESAAALPSKTPTATPAETTVISGEFAQTFKSHFGFMPALWDFEHSRAAGGAYDRPFFELFRWDMIEKNPGVFDFYTTDQHVRQAQEYGLHILANIQPFAYWDQAICHGPQPTGNANKPGVQSTKYKPCDMAAYANFVNKLVERYDGDSINDMPGLTVPIKHWELMNEPEFQTNIIYFQGTPADYVDVLKVTYETVKQADPEAYIVQGGMAGMMPESAAWWQGVFDAGGGDYLDILNMHSIGHGEHLNIPSFKQLLAKNGLQDKPIWVTEVQYQQAQQTQNFNNQDFAKTLARSYVFALANGVDKLFYVNIRMPPSYDSHIPFDERSALITNNGGKSALFQAHLTVANILGNRSKEDTVEKIRERVVGWFIEEAQYKFSIQGKTIYVLWGSGPLPAEITGDIRVFDITGTERVANASSLQLSDSPIFVLPD